MYHTKKGFVGNEHIKLSQLKNLPQQKKSPPKLGPCNSVILGEMLWNKICYFFTEVLLSTISPQNQRK